MTTNSPLRTTSTKSVAYAYSRFSTKEQAQGDSGRRQKDNAQAFADAEGSSLEHLLDPGISAFHGRNQIIGQFSVFLEAVRARRLGPNPILLIENFDRISREVIEEAQSLFLELINAGATIVTLHNGKRYAKGMGLVDIMTALIEMDVAHQHSAKLSMRVREAVEARRKAGGIIHNRSSCPGWLTIDPKRTRFEHNPERIKLIKEMFARAQKGEGARAIARAFNSRYEPTWTKAKYWREKMIHDVLHTKAVLGEFKGKAGYFGSPVVTPEEWATVNDPTTRRAQGRGNGVIMEHNLFAGFIVSGIDGTRMIHRQSGFKNRKTGQYTWYPFLVSLATINGQTKHPHRISYTGVENRVLWLMENLDPEIMVKVRSGAHDDTQDRVTMANQQIQSLEKQVAKLTRLIVNDDDPSPSLVSQLKDHEAQLRIARTGLEALTVAAKKNREIPVLPNQEEMTRPEVRRALRKNIAQMCEKIEVSDDHLIVWFTKRTGIRVNLTGEPKAAYHDLAEVEFRAIEETAAEYITEQQRLAV